MPEGLVQSSAFLEVFAHFSECPLIEGTICDFRNFECKYWAMKSTKHQMTFFKSYLIGAGLLALLVSGCFAQPTNANPTSISAEAQEGVPEGWITDYQAALTQAKAEGKHVLIDFTGSDWCGWCIKLHDEILSQPEFAAYAEEHLVLLYLDFPRRTAQTDELKEQNQLLAQRFGVQGFPTLFLLDGEGTPVARLGYMRGGPEPFLQAVREALGGS